MPTRKNISALFTDGALVAPCLDVRRELLPVDDARLERVTEPLPFGYGELFRRGVTQLLVKNHRVYLPQYQFFHTPRLSPLHILRYLPPKKLWLPLRGLSLTAPRRTLTSSTVSMYGMMTPLA